MNSALGDFATRLELTTRFSFFTGKGGVGKTTTACAIAVALAERGERTLLVSTDPASNLGDLFGRVDKSVPTPLAGLPALSLLDIDPVAAAAAYRERIVTPYRGVLPASALQQMEEQLSGACTVEIAAFDEFTALLTDPALLAQFDRVVFDTAPTGHTLRLLALPAAWTGFLGSAENGASCLGPLAGLEQQRARYAEAVRALSDGALTTVVIVSRADHAPLLEAARASVELRAIGLAHQRLVLNAVLPERSDANGKSVDATEVDAVTRAWYARQRSALEQMPADIATLPRLTVPMLTGDLTGLDALRALASGESIDAAIDAATSGQDHATVGPALEAPDPAHASLASFDDLIASLACESHGAILTMGKGGVGKTTVARRIALALAERGLPVHLSTTDPAGVDFAFANSSPALRVSRIDAAAEIAAYTDEVMRAAGPLDAHERELLAEDLRSPCTEEIAVFRAFARILADAQNAFVVLDTAPTGHTILLLDAAQAYHREVAKSTGAVPPEVAALLPRLRDPAFTRVLVVTLAEFTPVAEAERLVEDLARAGITPYGWVVNGLLSQTNVQHPLLRARADQEAGPLARVARASTRTWGLPWQALVGESDVAKSDTPGGDAGAPPPSPGALALHA